MEITAIIISAYILIGVSVLSLVFDKNVSEIKHRFYDKPIKTTCRIVLAWPSIYLMYGYKNIFSKKDYN